jgi:hypothetical protein
MQELVEEDVLVDWSDNEDDLGMVNAESADEESVVEDEPVAEAVVQEEPVIAVVETIVEQEPVIAVVDTIFEQEPVIAVVDTIFEQEPAIAVVDTIVDQEFVIAVVDTIVDQEPVTEDVVQDEPATETIVEQEPVMAVVVQDEPVTEDVVQDEPVTEDVIQDEPVTETIVEQEPVVAVVVQDEPVTEDIVEQEPVVAVVVQDEPVTEDIVEQELATEDIVEQEPVIAVVVQEEPVTEDIVEEEPVTAVEEQPVTEDIVEEEPESDGFLDSIMQIFVPESSASVHSTSPSGRFEFQPPACPYETSLHTVMSWGDVKNGYIKDSNYMFPGFVAERKYHSCKTPGLVVSYESSIHVANANLVFRVVARDDPFRVFEGSSSSAPWKEVKLAAAALNGEVLKGKGAVAGTEFFGYGYLKNGAGPGDIVRKLGQQAERAGVVMRVIGNVTSARNKSQFLSSAAPSFSAAAATPASVMHKSTPSVVTPSKKRRQSKNSVQAVCTTPDVMDHKSVFAVANVVDFESDAESEEDTTVRHFMRKTWNGLRKDSASKVTLEDLRQKVWDKVSKTNMHAPSMKQVREFVMERLESEDKHKHHKRACL